MHLVNESKGTMNLFTYITTQKATYPSIAWYEINQKLQAMDVKPEGYRDFSSGEALRSWYRRERQKVNTVEETNKLDVSIPVGIPAPFDEPLFMSMAITLVIADLHCPFHDEFFIRELLERVQDQYYTIDQIVIAGDLFDFDQISRHSKDHNMPRLETEMEIAGSMLLSLANIAPVYLCSGNHDNRVSSKLDTGFSLKRLINSALNGRTPKHTITTTNREYLFLGNSFVIGHLSKYSTSAGKIAQNIAQKYQRHALVGHDHIAGVGGNTKYIGASIGCCASTEKFWYSESKLTTFPPSQKGYAVISAEDQFTLYNEHHEPYFERTMFNDSISYNCFMVK